MYHLNNLTFIWLGNPCVYLIHFSFISLSFSLFLFFSFSLSLTLSLSLSLFSLFFSCFRLLSLSFYYLSNMNLFVFIAIFLFWVQQFAGMVPLTKRPALEKSDLPVFQPPPSAYQQALAIHQSFVPLACKFDYTFYFNYMLFSHFLSLSHTHTHTHSSSSNWTSSKCSKVLKELNHFIVVKLNLVIYFNKI